MNRAIETLHSPSKALRLDHVCVTFIIADLDIDSNLTSILLKNTDLKASELRSYGAGLSVAIAPDPKQMLLTETGSATAAERPSHQEDTVQRREVVLKARHPFTMIAADSWGFTAETMQPLWSLRASCGSAGILNRQLLSYN